MTDDDGAYQYAPVKRWDKGIDLGYEPLATSKLMFPIHVRNNHWVLCAVDVHAHTVTMYDSLKSCGNEDHAYTHDKLMGNVLSYVLDRAARTKPVTVLPPASDWKREVADVPQQENGNDCGVYALSFLLIHSTRSSVASYTFSDHIPALRKALAAWLVTGRTKMNAASLCR